MDWHQTLEVNLDNSEYKLYGANSWELIFYVYFVITFAFLFSFFI